MSPGAEAAASPVAPSAGPHRTAPPGERGMDPRDAALPDEWVIEPRSIGLFRSCQEVWRYRRMVRFFAARAVEKLYRRTVLGRAWILIRPLFPVVVGTVIFGELLNAPSDDVPYFLFLLVSSAVWGLFSGSVMWATRSLELNRKILKRLYVPRLILPVAMVAPALLEFAIYLGLIVAAAAYYAAQGHLYVAGGPRLLAALGAAAASLLLALGVGLWTSVLGALARDVRFTLSYVLSFWLYLTPVIYPLSAVPERWRWLCALNPMASLVETFRWGVLGIGGPDPRALGMAAIVLVAVVTAGLWFFVRAEAAAIDRS